MENCIGGRRVKINGWLEGIKTRDSSTTLSELLKQGIQ